MQVKISSFRPTVPEIIFSQTTPNTSLNISSTHEEKDMDIEQGDDNQENIEVSYSTHLRERENVQKLLKGRDLMFVTLSAILYSQPLVRQSGPL